MRKLILMAAAVAMVSTTAFAAMPVGSFALGWVDQQAPIGIRYQIAEKIAGDVGVGFASFDGGDTEIRVGVGVPIELIAHNRCSLDFRPGFLLTNTSPDNSDFDSYMDFVVHLWLAFNVMITDNVGLNAAHGVDFMVNGEQTGSVNGVNFTVDSTTDMMTTAADVTSLGLFFWF